MVSDASGLTGPTHRCDSIANVSPQCIAESSHAAQNILTQLADDTTLSPPSNINPAAILQNLAKNPDVTSCISDEERRVDY